MTGCAEREGGPRSCQGWRGIVQVSRPKQEEVRRRLTALSRYIQSFALHVWASHIMTSWSRRHMVGGQVDATTAREWAAGGGKDGEDERENRGQNPLTEHSCAHQHPTTPRRLLLGPGVMHPVGHRNVPVDASAARVIGALASQSDPIADCCRSDLILENS